MAEEAETSRCPRCGRLEREVEKLQERVKQLLSEVERLTELLEKSQRGAKRQAAPFSKGEPKKKPKKPGRKAGRRHGRHGHRPPPRPDQIDEVHEAELPPWCPGCAGQVEPTEVQPQFQTEIPRRAIHRQFNVHIGRCCDCGRRVQGRHPLQTSDALGAAASQLGPDLQATIAELNKGFGASYDKIRRLLQSVFDIRVTNGGCARAVLRMGRRLAPVYESVKDAVAQQPSVSTDETGWRVAGRKAWLHVVAAAKAVCYVIHRRRDASAARAVIGTDYAGTMVHDGWSPYDQFESASHQQCLAHLLRRCNEMLEVATRGAVRFPRAVKRLLQDALKLRARRDAGEISEHGLRVAVGRLRSRLDKLLQSKRTNGANRRFAKHLERHRDELFTFLLEPGVDATNYRAEQALRPAVVNRKVWGGNRTWRGAMAQSILMTVLQTCVRQGRSAIDYVSEVLRRREHAPPLVPVRSD